MPSSITLTVSHLPTSTSFFLSALQPLRYGYRGRADQTVGFGPVNSSAPADFWITQECPGVPVGAAHVAFPAPSREAVQDFFHAALKAGATIHGEPCVRDAHGYFSAAVIDFDGNSIEAVHRPGFGEENKENYANTVVSKRSSSRAPSTVSRAPSSASKVLTIAPTTVSKAPSAAPPPEPAPKTQGDALETLLNQARSTADVARKLVEQVRPHLPTSMSAPAVPATKEHIHNPDAFAKPGDGGNAVIGTLLGVAAGAALTYAFTSTHKPSPDTTTSEAPRGRRPSIAGRSATAPSHHHIPHYHHALEPPPSHYISLQDHDSASSTIKPTHRRRGSIDSALGISPPTTTSTSSARKPPGPRLIEAPPTSYKAPTVITQAPTAVTAHTHRSSRSRTRHNADNENASRSSSKHRHRSSSRSSRLGHARHDSGVSVSGHSGYETVLHVTTQRAYGPVAVKEEKEGKRSSSRSPPSARWAEHKTVPLPYESGLSARSKVDSRLGGKDNKGKEKQRDRSGDGETEGSSGGSGRKKRSSSRSAAGSKAGSQATAVRTPLPPSRAATWVAGGPGSSSNEKAESFVSRARGGGGGGYGGMDDGSAKTVIGKMRDVEGLKVRPGEVRPEDSVSQVSSVRSGRR